MKARRRRSRVRKARKTRKTHWKSSQIPPVPWTRKPMRMPVKGRWKPFRRRQQKNRSPKLRRIRPVKQRKYRRQCRRAPCQARRRAASMCLQATGRMSFRRVRPCRSRTCQRKTRSPRLRMPWMARSWTQRVRISHFLTSRATRSSHTRAARSMSP